MNATRNAPQSLEHAGHGISRPVITAALALLTMGELMAGFSEKSFAEPPIQSRPSALWTWMNAHVDRQQLTRELEDKSSTEATNARSRSCVCGVLADDLAVRVAGI